MIEYPDSDINVGVPLQDGTLKIYGRTNPVTGRRRYRYSEFHGNYATAALRARELLEAERNNPIRVKSAFAVSHDPNERGRR